MSRNIELLKSEIRHELGKIQALKEEFARIVSERVSLDGEVPFYDRGALGYYLHNFYNGCENIFLSIARFFENDLSRDSWHSDLLKRMMLDVPGYRPAVIDEAMYIILTEFRGFRHVFRHSYNFDLNWEKEKPVLLKLEATAGEFIAQVERFLSRLDGLED